MSETVTADNLKAATPSQLRAAFRREQWTGPTLGLGLGYVQANLAVVPEENAFDFMRFCQRNPKACPLVHVTDPGVAQVPSIAPGADLRSDLPRYRLFRDGVYEREMTDATDVWEEDAVAFLLGCSLTFEFALMQAGIPLRHLEAETQAPVYTTSIECEPAGVFRGPLVVSMRPIPAALVPLAVQISSRYPWGHGAPLHIGAPVALGIDDLNNVDFGEKPVMDPGDVPVFWGCGITPQLAVKHARPRYMITHFPEHMFISDLVAEATASH